ncbi:uncharacterized protein LOC135817348 [Sycon ciliatum]|uniref:uncharacterized protein LOC135817348 n=1 Tax=Sycon ciliatum TaxID=27933 RepID=UPI0031F676BE
MAVYTVNIERDGGELGFSVKGGREHGIGILVSSVDPRGIAHSLLEVGDEILYVNGLRLCDMTHGEAVQIIRGAGNDLTLTIQHHASIQSALATSVGDIEKMKTDFERMREKIRSRPLAPTQAMQGAPEARSFPFPPFLSSRWTTSREDDSVIQSPTDPPTDSPMLKTEAEPSQNDSVAVSRAPNRTPSSGVLPGMSQRPVSREETDGGSEAHELQRGMKIVKTSKVSDVRRGSLPEGWVQRLDPRTDQCYYENHWLGLSFWTDPRTLPPAADVLKYDWSDLPIGWKQFVDKNGFVYYINHHNHTSHWESPTLTQQSKLLAQVKTHYNEVDERLQAEAKTLKQKREALLKNRDELQRLTAQRDAMEKPGTPASTSSSGNSSRDQDIKNSLNGLVSAVVEEVMQLNEAVEGLSSQLGDYRKGLAALEVLRRQAQEELNSGTDLVSQSSNLAKQLHSTFAETVSLHRQKLAALYRLEGQRKRQRRRSSMLAGPGRLNASLSPQRSISFDGGECLSPDTSLLYMLQLPDAKPMPASVDSDGDDDTDGMDNGLIRLPADPRDTKLARRIHVLGDELTVKCNLEMRVDIALLQQLSTSSRSCLGLLKSWEEEVRHNSHAWTSVVDKLTGLEDLMETAHFEWLALRFKEKLKKLTGS